MSRADDYERARQWMRGLAVQPLAAVTHRPPAGRVFIDVTIEGQRFQGVRIRDTLYVSGKTGACALGVASINQARRYDHSPPNWHICKYWNEATCELTLTPAGMRALAITFGMPIVPLARQSVAVDLFEREHFYDSPAFAALHDWAAKVPRRVAGTVGDSYLGLWPLSALEGRYLAPTEEHLARARAANPQA